MTDLSENDDSTGDVVAVPKPRGGRAQRRDGGGSAGSRKTASAVRNGAGDPNGDSSPDVVAFIELLFFAYRDFVHDPDAILDEFGFGRAHHRVLHFVHRHPGIRVARLLDVLDITKQSLARVLRQLIAEDHVRQETGRSDRRERKLFLTDNGAALYARLVAPQQDRISEALRAAGSDADRAAVERFLMAIIERDARAGLAELVSSGAPVGTNESKTT